MNVGYATGVVLQLAMPRSRVLLSHFDEVQASWAGVLDPTWWKPSDYVQAVTHELTANDVVRVVKLAGSPRTGPGVSPAPQ